MFVKTSEALAEPLAFFDGSCEKGGGLRRNTSP
jgi:hypothetical protein